MKTMIKTLIVLVICTCVSSTQNDATRDEIKRLKEYLINVEFLEQEDQLKNAKEIGAEETTLIDVCKAQMEVAIDLTDDVNEFRDDVMDLVQEWNKCLGKWNSKTAYATWDFETDITDENQKKLTDVEVDAAAFYKQLSSHAQLVQQHELFGDLGDDLQRQVRLLAFNDEPKSQKDKQDLVDVQVQLKQIYSTAKVEGLVLDPDLVQVLAKSRDPEVLLGAWWGWRDATGPKMKDQYAEMVRLLNVGATDNGFPDFATAWISSQFDGTSHLEAEAERLWLEIRPLYLELHAYVRHRLEATYSDIDNDPRRIFKSGAIPAHLLGNMWAQEWINIYDLVKPFSDEPEVDYSTVMQNRNMSADQMFHMAEEFYTSLGLPAMTPNFNANSMKIRPEGREVVCHASAFDFYTTNPSNNDFRIKMCTQPNMDSFETIHHEMGHIEYFMAYQNKPTVYRDGANSAFHEAIGDTISLSVMTRRHLDKVLLGKDADQPVAGDADQQMSGDAKHQVDVDQQVDAIQRGPLPTQKGKEKQVPKSDINFLLKRALFKVAFLPFGYLMDKWRWDVLRGNVTKDEYNRHWWDLRLEYQGLVSPISRSERDFDPGSKYHIPDNSPYICYFISFIVQFQFYEAMCEASGHTGPLYNCDVYRSKDAGDKLRAMLQLGKSKPWPDAMETLTGSRHVDSAAILKYFEPLHVWLKKENKRLNNDVGWEKAKTNFKA
ncbi:angiotensin-converting enzyme-like [Mya arenaria]|uniref:angiotensin-converting enzyme-like n=1 Tax=Mya arenaria TaxID=6604 RepID=UPI0022E22416|nr:angiotensin-converting enzyme-like [Mya arenaria]XP_052805934.1 angiotensin-converting enzyme-like [Mya arenaria]XP_052805936.1 angiotensin-converting enzyme-like [Mya arenaria]XP_052805937.1 angiotensin-converting enzyme-like [Mya arenaria]